MKPIKNRIFCMECQRPKMLFESKSKAINFIKFNADEIKDENGIAPTRVYFCKSCGGWHVTSRVHPVSERKKIRNLIGKAYRLLGDKRWASAQRFLCYAADNLRIVNERLIPSPVDDNLKSEITKAKKKLDNVCAKLRGKFSSSIPLSIFKSSDLNFNDFELEVISSQDDEKNKGILYSIRPQLLAQYDGAFYYVICCGKLNEKEFQITRMINGFSETDDSIQTIISHCLNIVEIKQDLVGSYKNQYESVADYFEGEVITAWPSGLALRVIEKVMKKYKNEYYRFSGFDYWIKIAGRNVHFYLGRHSKYTCIVSPTPLNTETTFSIFKSVI